MRFLRQSTASQVIDIGPLIDDTDFKTPKTGLTLANTDILINKHSTTSLVAKNSGGATEISNGTYYCTIDATDSNTVGRMKIQVKKAATLQWWCEYQVLSPAVYDALIAGSAYLDINVYSQRNIDFGALQKASLNAATPSVTVSDKTGFSLSVSGIQAIWDKLTSALTAIGSIGKFIIDKLGGSASVIDWPFPVTDINGLPIEGAEVWVTTDAGGVNVVTSGVTDSLGIFVFKLDPGSYYFWAKHSGDITGFVKETVA